MPTTASKEAEALIRRRHPEYREHHVRWRWLMDSFEGGDRYRSAIYGYEWMGGSLPVRNLIRHKREYPDPRETSTMLGSTYAAGLATGAGGAGNALSGLFGATDQAAFANVDDYELRRARTPVPTFVREAIDTHLSKIHAKEVSRPADKNPSVLVEWWEDVDGEGTNVKDWMEQTIGPVFLCLGQIDILVDHPPRPEGATLATKADQSRLGLNRAVASYILPENMLWWQREGADYCKVLMRELIEDPTDEDRELAKSTQRASGERGDALESHPARYRYWDENSWTLYAQDGTIIESGTHPYGRPPIIRVFDRRKPRCRNIGQSRYEGIAERQREYYNRDSELILSDTTQAFPLLQGPEDFVRADGTVPIGPGWLLPKKKNTQGGSATYEGFDVVDFPKGGADSIRENKRDLRDEVDRDAGMTKPAGVSGTGRSTVAQSGVSKSLDNQTGFDKLTQIKGSLESLERKIAELALLVLSDGRPNQADVDAIAITYPTAFDLESAEVLAKGLADFQTLVAGTGKCPATQALWLQKIARENLKGLASEQYDEIDREIDEEAAAQSQEEVERIEGTVRGPRVRVDPNPPGNDELGAQDTPETPPSYSSLPVQAIGR